MILRTLIIVAILLIGALSFQGCQSTPNEHGVIIDS